MDDEEIRKLAAKVGLEDIPTLAQEIPPGAEVVNVPVARIVAQQQAYEARIERQRAALDRLLLRIEQLDGLRVDDAREIASLAQLVSDMTPLLGDPTFEEATYGQLSRAQLILQVMQLKERVKDLETHIKSGSVPETTVADAEWSYRLRTPEEPDPAETAEPVGDTPFPPPQMPPGEERPATSF